MLQLAVGGFPSSSETPLLKNPGSAPAGILFISPNNQVSFCLPSSFFSQQLDDNPFFSSQTWVDVNIFPFNASLKFRVVGVSTFRKLHMSLKLNVHISIYAGSRTLWLVENYPITFSTFMICKFSNSIMNHNSGS